MSFTIAIIKENTFNYSDVDKTCGKLTNDVLENDLEDHVEFKKVADNDEMLEIICKTIKLEKHMIANNTIVYQDSFHVYELYHIENTENKNINAIAISLANFTYRIIGSAVLVKYKLNNDFTGTPCEITIGDIITLYKNTFIHTGLVIDETDVSEFTYFKNPISIMDRNNTTQNYRYHEFELFDNKIAQMFIELKPENGELNRKASLLYKQAPIYGKVVLALRQKPADVHEPEITYHSITKDTFERLICVLNMKDNNISKDAPVVPTNDNNTETTQVKLRQISNFYTILDKTHNIFTTNKCELVLEECVNLKAKSLNETSYDFVNSTTSS